VLLQAPHDLINVSQNNQHRVVDGVTLDDGYVVLTAERVAPPLNSKIEAGGDNCFMIVADTVGLSSSPATTCRLSYGMTRGEGMCTGTPVCFSKAGGDKLDVKFISEKSRAANFFIDGKLAATKPDNCPNNNDERAADTMLHKVAELVVSPWESGKETIEGGNKIIKWIDEPTLVLPQNMKGPNIYHAASAFTGAMQFMGHTENYGITKKITNIAQIGDGRIGQWAKDMFKAAVPENTVLTNVFTEIENKNSMVCYSNPVVVDMGFGLLQFLNTTELKEESPPVFSRDAQVLKERVYRRLRLPSQVTGYYAAKSPADLDDTILDDNSELFLGPPGKFLLYIYRPAETQDRSLQKHERIFSERSEKDLREMLQKYADENGLEFVVSNFATIGFEEQARLMRNTAILVALHGAALANTMFMPTGSVLIEIAPWHFYGAYGYFIQGGHSNVWSSLHLVQEPSEKGEYPDLKSKYGGDVAQCNLLDDDCLKFYRDQEVVLGAGDLQVLQGRLNKAKTWLSYANTGMRVKPSKLS
jgi:hypothetical protein